LQRSATILGVSRPRSESQANALKQLDEQADRVAAALTELEHLIVVAAEAGCPPRDIAHHAGVSHMTVRRCVKRFREVNEEIKRGGDPLRGV
jgi:transposase-like protein